MDLATGRLPQFTQESGIHKMVHYEFEADGI